MKNKMVWVIDNKGVKKKVSIKRLYRFTGDIGWRVKPLAHKEKSA